MTNYQRLLSDYDARRVLLVEVTYFNGSATAILRRGNEAWKSGGSDTPPDLPFSDGLTSDLNLEVGIDSGETLGGLAQAAHGSLTFANRSGEFDSWKVGYSVDGYDIRILMVGWLADGTAISYAEASAQPLFVGVGRGRPSVSTTAMEIAVKGDLYRFDKPLCTKLFSPQCLHFPGTAGGLVDFGDVLDRSGSFTLEFWIKTENPSLASQLVVSKDTGTAGVYIDIGTAGSGALRFGIREQTPATSDTATGVIRIGQDHHVAVVWDASAGKRYIYVDRTLLVTTTVTAGVPAGNAASFQIGKGFLGAISRGRIWSTARTLQQIGSNMLVPLLGTGVSQEFGLDEMLSMNEGQGGTTWGQLVGSTVIGTLGTGVTWTTSTWCGSSLVGKRWPVVVGKVLDLQLAPIDPAFNIFAASWPPPVSVPVVRSNHNALTPGSGYTVDYRGLVTLTGAAGGTISADVAGETMFGGAVHYDGSTGYASGTVTCPAGTMALGALIRLEDSSTTRVVVAFRQASGNVGLRGLSIGSATPFFEVGNDAGTRFFILAPPIPLNTWVSLLGVLDAIGNQIRLYLNGALVASASTTGTFSTTVTTFAIGRRPSAAQDYFQGVIDEVTTWQSALVTSDAEALTVAPAIQGCTSLTNRWACDDGSGSNLSNAVAGGATLSLTGTFTWTQSRIAPADLAGVLATRYAGYGNNSILLDGSSGYAAGTVPCPAGSMSLHCWMLATTSSTAQRRIAGWDASGGPGERVLELASGSTNLLRFVVTNDQGVSFNCFITTTLSANGWSSVLCVLDLTLMQIRIYLDGLGGGGSVTSVTGTFNTTASAFALGRTATGASSFLPGAIDEASIWQTPLGSSDADALKRAPVLPSAAGLTQAWHCDEGQGRLLTNAVAGGAPLTVVGGFRWQVGASPSGITITAPNIDTSASAAFLRQTVADCGWPFSGTETVADAVHLILKGLHSAAVPDPNTRKLVMGQVAPPTGTPDPMADFNDGSIPAKEEVTSADDKLVAPVYKVDLGYAQNWNPMPASQLAGIVTTQPDRYQFGQEQWRTAPVQNLTILTNYPQARVLAGSDPTTPFPTPLLNQSDALVEAARILPFYGPTLETDLFVFRTAGLGLTANSEMRVTLQNADLTSRLGMTPPGKSYRVTHVTRVNNRVTTKGWRY